MNLRPQTAVKTGKPRQRDFGSATLTGRCPFLDLAIGITQNTFTDSLETAKGDASPQLLGSGSADRWKEVQSVGGKTCSRVEAITSCRLGVPWVLITVTKLIFFVPLSHNEIYNGQTGVKIDSESKTVPYCCVKISYNATIIPNSF